MTLTLARRSPLGSPLQAFRLPEPLTGRLLGPEDFPAARAVLVAFLSNLCPEVRHLAGALAGLARDHEPAGLQVLAINPFDGDADREEAPAVVAAEALKRGYVFPYLIDQTRAVVRAFGAGCTPDFFLFDETRALFYHGRFDETRFGGGAPAHGRDLRGAIARALAGAPRPEHQVASTGCPIR
ncbi:MAG: alkyl hydroperoxide reductase [Phenylobacterium sp.]|nr:alkyl hydroperoxide reductase [Phenylobacterium sp.]